MITNIDSNGRIQLPLAIRYGLHLLPGDKIAVDQLGDGTIILKKIEERETLDVVGNIQVLHYAAGTQLEIMPNHIDHEFNRLGKSDL